MTIKQIFLSCALLITCSFSASTYAFMITSGSLAGKVFRDNAHAKSVLKGQCIAGSGNSVLADSTNLSGSYFDVNGYFYKYSTSCSGSRRYGALTFTVSSESCPAGTEWNQETGDCEELPPECENGQVWNPSTEMCDDFCDAPSTLDELFAAEQACASSGGIFDSQCSNGNALTPPSLETSCTQPNECVLGMPNFPECLGGLDPTDPVDPPDGGFNPDKPPPSDAKPPSFDKDDPDQVAPDSTTDKAVLTAIQNMNRDANNAATAINKDMNAGFATVETGLNTVAETNKSIGTAITSQTELQYKMFEANKELMLQNTGELKKIASQIGSGFETNTSEITDAIDGLGDKLDNIADDGEVSTSNCDSFTCDGDASTCYLAHQSWINFCRARSDREMLEDDLTALLRSAESASNEAYDENGAFVDIFTKPSESIDSALDSYDEQNGFSFDGGCPASRSYNVLGANFEIDYGPFCDLAIIFRVFIMATAAITSYLMIVKYI